eukprot:SAG11_NODE_574_length_8430_cov_11.461769_3_plen_99_part_00
MLDLVYEEPMYILVVVPSVDTPRRLGMSDTTLVQATGMLDRFHWGVWGSARRCRASARELRTLTAALWEAEWGAGDADLPGGSTYLEGARWSEPYASN